MARGRLPQGVVETASGRFKAHTHVKGKGKTWIKDRYGNGTFDTPEAAYEALQAFRRGTGPAGARSWTVREFFTAWSDRDGGYMAHRQESYRQWLVERVKPFVEEFADTPLTAIDRPTARRWAAANTARGQAVRTMFGDAESDDLIPANPFTGLKLPGLSRRGRGRKDITPLTEAEVGRLAQASFKVLDERFAPMYASFILFAAYTGMRFGELCGIQWPDIDWEQGEINVKRQWKSKTKEYGLPKNGEVRTITALEPALEAARTVAATYGRKFAEDDLIFATLRGARMSERNHYYYWRVVRQSFRDGLPADRQALIPAGFDFHELRHFHGSLLGDKGLTPQDIAFQLGHRDGGKLAMELYVHSYEDSTRQRIREAYNRPSTEADERERKTG